MTMIRTAAGLLALDPGTRVTSRTGEVWKRVTRNQWHNTMGDCDVECMVWVDGGEAIPEEYIDLEVSDRDYVNRAALQDLVAEGPFEIQEET